jgi:hypothetical protein
MMIGRPTAPDGRPNYENKPPLPFLSTPRALAPCTREFARLSASIAEIVAASLGGNVPDKIVIRQEPERCIVQVGSAAALTVAWIRNNRDTVAEGELLVILWRGMVAPSLRHQPERAAPAALLTATAISETVFVAEASSEADWGWRPLDAPGDRYSSMNLAHSLVDRLRVIHGGRSAVA